MTHRYKSPNVIDKPGSSLPYTHFKIKPKIQMP